MINSALHEASIFGLRALVSNALQKLTSMGAIFCVVAGIVACSHQSNSPTVPSVPTEIVMPKIVGKFWVDAEGDLRKMGWTGALIKGPDIPAEPKDLHRILAQLPAAGERVKSDVNVTAQFGS